MCKWKRVIILSRAFSVLEVSSFHVWHSLFLWMIHVHARREENPHAVNAFEKSVQICRISLRDLSRSATRNCRTLSEGRWAVHSLEQYLHKDDVSPRISCSRLLRGRGKHDCKGYGVGTLVGLVSFFKGVVNPGRKLWDTTLCSLLQSARGVCHCVGWLLFEIARMVCVVREAIVVAGLEHRGFFLARKEHIWCGLSLW